VLDLFERRSLSRFCTQDRKNEFPEFSWEGQGNYEVAVDDSVHSLSLYMVRIYRLCLEGSSSSGHFVDEHSQAPNIDFLIICLSFQNLRRNIVQCSTKGISFVFGSISRPSKIGQLRHPLTQQYILRFEISVEDRLGMAILQGLNHLLGVVPDCILIELDSEKLTLFCILAKRHF